jgi:hypothetical protein
MFNTRSLLSVWLYWTSIWPLAEKTFAERCAMTPDHIPPDALFIQWGRFKAGASGRTAIIGLLGLIGAVVFVKLVGWL